MNIEPQTFCNVMWHGQERRFALAAPDNLLCFWESDVSPQERLFVVLEELYDLCSESEYKPITLDGLQRRFLFKWDCSERGQRAWARVVPLDDKTDVLLHPSGRGEIRVLCSEPENYSYLESPPRAFQQNEIRVPFLFHEGTEVLEWSLTRWQEELNHWNTIPDSDFAFALRWIMEEDRSAQLYVFSRGDWEEMEMVLGWLSLLESDALFLNPPQEQRTPDEVSISLIFCMGEHVYSHPELYTTGVRFPALWRTWFDFFSPSLNRENLNKHIAAREEQQSANQEYWVNAQAVTAHEKIETLLQLRDWLSKHVGMNEESIEQILA